MNRPRSHNITAFCLFIALIFVVSTTEVNAQSARSRAMGGAFIGLSNDESATYYNPAGLSQIQGREASFQSKVNETDVFDWKSAAFTGHIYEDGEEDRFSITDYLEHNVLEEPMPRKPKYSYGVAYSVGDLSEKYGTLVGNPGVSRKNHELQLAFGTRFPIARRMLAREQLFAGIKLNYAKNETKYAKTVKSRETMSLGAGFMYHYNDRITGGFTIDNILQTVDASNGEKTSKDDAIFSIGAAMKVTEGTTISADIVNLADSKDVAERQLRVGVEKTFVENDLTMRMGSHNGTLTLGFGMSLLPNVRMDYAYYDGDEVAEHYVGAHMTFD